MTPPTSPTSPTSPADAGAWTWTLEDADGEPVVVAEATPPREGFAAQADAETWVGLHWRTLLDGGAEGAVLHVGRRRVYGPMPLRPAE